MKSKTLFAGALVTTTAVNILFASDAHAWEPNGWKQAGKDCYTYDGTGIGGVYRDNHQYHKFEKKNDGSKFGVYKNKNKWIEKGVSLAVANAKMNAVCEGGYYGGTSSDDPRDQPSY